MTPERRGPGDSEEVKIRTDEALGIANEFWGKIRNDPVAVVVLDTRRFVRKVCDVLERVIRRDGGGEKNA